MLKDATFYGGETTIHVIVSTWIGIDEGMYRSRKMS